MKITTTKIRNKSWISDFIELPGSPSIGSGRTEVEAVIALFIRNKDNLKKLNCEIVELNGKLWREAKPC